MQQISNLPIERAANSVEPAKLAHGDQFSLLRGTVIRYDKPTEPVAEEDWEAASDV
jgi:hypothetical protein